MPRPIFERDAQWRTDNADMIEWLASDPIPNSRFLRSMRSWLDTHESLTERQTEATRSIMRDTERNSTTRAVQLDPAAVSGHAGYDPAGPGDLTNLFNGVYTITHEGAHLTYQIYTATRGDLRGQRLLKMQTEYGRFQGFATILRDGTVWVWRRFRDQADETWVQRGIRLVSLLLGRDGDDVVSYDPNTVDRTWEFASEGWTVQASTFCRSCNRALTDPTSISLGIGPDCRSNLLPPRTVPADRHATEGESATVTFPGASLREDRPTCPICGVICESEQALVSHEDALHPREVAAMESDDEDDEEQEYPSFRCGSCTHEATSNADLVEHRHVVHGILPIRSAPRRVPRRSDHSPGYAGARRTRDLLDAESRVPPSRSYTSRTPNMSEVNPREIQ